MSDKGKKEHNEEGAQEIELEEDEFTLEAVEDIMTELDPHLQEIILASRAEEPIDPSVGEAAEDGTIVVDVIAKLGDPNIEVPGLTVVRKIGQICTGTVAVSQIESVRTHENVISLKRATKLRPELEFSLPEIRAGQDQLRDAMPFSSRVVDGSGVIVGVVDYGCDFVHHNFRNPDGTTRLLYLWDQRGSSSSISPEGFGYGREFDTAMINTALQASNPYQALAYNPATAAKPPAHGTHMMDIAAGNGEATGLPGVSPKADLIFVQVAAWDYGAEESFGNSRRLLEAVDYIFEKAKELGKSAVVNLSLGTHGGPHDGSTLVEQGFDQLLQVPGRAIVIAVGNSWQRRSHASGEIEPGHSRALSWNIGTGDETDNELEVWYAGTGQLDVTLITPGGQRLGPVPAGTTFNLTQQGVRVGRIIHRPADPNNGDNHIDILLNRSLPSGAWQVELQVEGAEPVLFHAWIERDDKGQSQFAPEDDDRTHTVGSISCGQHTLVAGSYDARVPNRALSHFTAEGPTRDGKQKPELSAPGQAVLAARSNTQGLTSKSGTSMATPHVTGLVALVMQAANRTLHIGELRQTLLENARNDPPAGSDWDSRYGMGRIDGIACVLSQLCIPASEVHDLIDEEQPLNSPVVSDSSVLPDHAPQIVDGLLAEAAHTAVRSRLRVRVQVEFEPAND